MDVESKKEAGKNSSNRNRWKSSGLTWFQVKYFEVW
jgi:aspartyl/asparaginyl beta-hydroxylase (cupin superfamily)